MLKYPPYRQAYLLAGGTILLLVASMLWLDRPIKKATIKVGNCQFQAKIARTQSQKAAGLSGQKSIKSNEAMIFPFHNEQPSFWMKEMLFSIDIIWVDDGRVVKIDPNLPLDNGAASYYPDQPIDWVVEVLAGQAKACGLTTEDRITGLPA